MSDEISLDLSFASEYTILPMTRDCHKRFLTLDKLREDAQAAAAASATAAHLPPQIAPDVYFQPSFVGQPLPDFFLASQLAEPGPSQPPESCLWQTTVAAPETYLHMGDYLMLPDVGTDASYAGAGPMMLGDGSYPYYFSGTSEPSPPSLSHTPSSLPNTPLRTPRSTSVTPPHANANPANPAAASLFPGFAPQQQIALPQLPPAQHLAAPQSRKAKGKKKAQPMNSQRPGLMDIVLTTRDLQASPQPSVRISRQQPRPYPVPAPSSQPVAGPSRLPAQAGAPQPPVPAFAMPFPYGIAPAYPQAQAHMLAYTHAAPASASSARARPVSGAGPTRPAKTKERSAPYSKRGPAAQKQQQHHSQQQQHQPASSALPASSLSLPVPAPPPPMDELPTSHLTSPQVAFFDIHGISLLNFNMDDWVGQCIDESKFDPAADEAPLMNATS